MNDEILNTLPYDGSSEPPSEDEGAQLLALEGPLRSRVFPLDREVFAIGRTAENDLVLPSGSVSKKHASIRREADLFYIEDLGSTNGVHVNGTRLEVGVARGLSHGDNFSLAEHLFLFRQEKPLVDASGLSNIQLDHAKIEAEADELLRDWRLATTDRS